ncbi:MAG: helix-hairpin-helix domain-containing protein [Alphaproteobacteria bacterium]|nr:helix-hairpin-helix domain-containing protein [Alphaproteobacteria bacterium]
MAVVGAGNRTAAAPDAPGEVGGAAPAGASAFNRLAAERLRDAAALLAHQDENPFRAAAYRRAADAVAALDTDLHALLDAGGVEALERIPGVGPRIAAALAELARTGRWIYLERLRGSAEPRDVFSTIPGVGPALAERLHETLHVETLEQLEAALHEAEPKPVPGIGPRRLRLLRAALAEMLARIRPARIAPAAEPPVAMLLDVDREYRARAQAGELRKIAPKRLNPAGEAWLPILHTRRGAWEFTALYSNTVRAHELGKVEDWVVLYFHADSGGEAQRTVVTETRGPLAGRRVVRGRERECFGVYERAPPR